MRAAAILDRAHPMNANCVFAWDARFPTLELTTGRKGIMSANVTSSLSQAGAMARKFAGGAFGASQIDFGIFTPTNSLHFRPATWLSYMHFGNISPGSEARIIACQSDNNIANGWQLGADNQNSNQLGLTTVKTIQDMRVTTPITECPTGWHAVGVTSAGTDGNAVQFWVDGQKVTTQIHTLGIGTSNPNTTDPLLIAQHRFQAAASSNEALGNLRMFSQILPDVWMRFWGLNPYLGFISDALTSPLG